MTASLVGQAGPDQRPASRRRRESSEGRLGPLLSQQPTATIQANPGPPTSAVRGWPHWKIERLRSRPSWTPSASEAPPLSVGATAAGPQDVRCGTAGANAGVDPLRHILVSRRRGGHYGP